MKSQTTDTLLMVRPAKFGFNAETAKTNIFQRTIPAADSTTVHEKALKEFDDLVKKLREHKIYVIVLQDPGFPATPDSIFPNNWISFEENKMILYPMLAENRRKERRNDWISLLKDEFHIEQIIDLSPYENQHKFLEGTGSMVPDRLNRVLYSNLSSRTNEGVLKDFSEKMDYDHVYFTAKDKDGREIYHTNVLMAIGEKTALLCSEVISDDGERENLLEKLSTYHEVVEISYGQMLQFAGNMLLVKNRDGENFWVMSEQAFRSLTSSQKEILRTDGDFIYCNLETIETVGGGSARCMMCEVI